MGAGRSVSFFRAISKNTPGLTHSFPIPRFPSHYATRLFAPLPPPPLPLPLRHPLFPQLSFYIAFDTRS